MFASKSPTFDGVCCSETAINDQSEVAKAFSEIYSELELLNRAVEGVVSRTSMLRVEMPVPDSATPTGANNVCEVTASLNTIESQIKRLRQTLNYVCDTLRI